MTRPARLAAIGLFALSMLDARRSAGAGRQGTGLPGDRRRARPQRCRQADRPAPPARQDAGLHRRQGRHEGARYGSQCRLLDRAARARGRPDRHGLGPGPGLDHRALREGQVRQPRQEPGDEECRACHPGLRRSDPAGCLQPRHDHLLLRLSRRDLHAGRPRQDEREDVRGVEARRLSSSSPIIPPSRAKAPRSPRRCTGSRKRRCARRSRRPASSSSPRAISCIIPKTPATTRCSSRPCRSTSSC